MWAEHAHGIFSSVGLGDPMDMDLVYVTVVVVDAAVDADMLILYVPVDEQQILSLSGMLWRPGPSSMARLWRPPQNRHRRRNRRCARDAEHEALLIWNRRASRLGPHG